METENIVKEKLAEAIGYGAGYAICLYRKLGSLEQVKKTIGSIGSTASAGFDEGFKAMEQIAEEALLELVKNHFRKI
jgi:hypothetical protein